MVSSQREALIGQSSGSGHAPEKQAGVIT
jgi:hypothetical protein